MIDENLLVEHLVTAVNGKQKKESKVKQKIKSLRDKFREMRQLHFMMIRFIFRVTNVKKFIQQKFSRNKTNEYTKMVNVISKRRKSALENDPIRQRMLKERQDHARRLEHDYSHVFRKKSRLELIRLSLIICGIEFAYSAETAFVSPILLSIGIEHKHMTMVWALSPFIAFFFSPILGSISDRCASRFGRRRPLIALMSIGLVLGLILAPWGRDIGRFLGDVGGVRVANLTNDDAVHYEYKTVDMTEGTGFFWAILFTVLGTLLLDFNADNCQTPSRAYLLDVCVPEEHAHALSTFTIMAGVGGCMGYALGAINWDQTIFANFIGDNIKTVFTLVTVIFICAMLFTITSFREIPLPLLESDEMLKPVTQMAVKKEKERLKDIENGDVKPTTTASFVSEKSQRGSISSDEAPSQSHTSNKLELSNISISSSEDDEDEDESITMMMYLKSIVFMPKPLRILCLTNLLSWMGHILYCLYFTDFVGETVFLGDPTAAVDSPEFDLYDQGIRFGCWGLALYAFSCAIYSMVIEKLIKRFTAKRMFVYSMLQFSVAMAILAYYPTKIGVLLFSTTAGVVYATLFTIPFLLVAQYHGKGTFKVKKPESNNNAEKVEEPAVEFERGLGMDCGIVHSMLFVAQFTMSLSIGSFITMIDSVAAVLYAASFFSFLAAISGCYVVYMDL